MVTKANEMPVDEVVADNIESTLAELGNGVPPTEPVVDTIEFGTGAKKELIGGEARCDLLPLDIVCRLMQDQDQLNVVYEIGEFINDGSSDHLYKALLLFADHHGWSSRIEMLLEVSNYYAQEAKEFGPDNWRKGIPLHVYINDAIKELFYYSDGSLNRRHDLAFVWNILSALWTIENLPKMIDMQFVLKSSIAQVPQPSHLDASSRFAESDSKASIQTVQELLDALEGVDPDTMLTEVLGSL